MSKYIEKAIELHNKGYNCAQAVLCAFEDKTDLDGLTLYRISEGFGAGMGNRKNTCGALSGAVALCGLIEAGRDTANSTKAETYKTVGKVVDGFEARCGAFVCEDIKGTKTGSPTASCDECIRVAVETVEEILFGQK